MSSGELDPALLAAIQEAVAAGMASQGLQPPASPALTMTTTPKLGLKQPALDDPALITDINDNMTILDDAITATVVATLYNKTLEAPVINNPTINGWTNANHTHLNPASGGGLDGAAITSGYLGTGLLLREGAPGGTLIDPIVRDTIQFAPEPTGAVDATLTRVAAGKLVTDGSFGLGGTPPDINTTYRVLWVGAQGAVRGSVAGADMGVSVNTRHAPDAKNYAVVAGGASLLSIGPGNAFYYTAANVAAGAEQAFSERFQIGATGDGTNVAVTSRVKDGGMGYQWFAGPATAGGAASPRWTLSVAGDTSSAPLILYSHGLDGVTFRERMRVNTHDGTTWFQGIGGDVILGAIRTAPATQAQYFRFWGGVARDAAIYRNPNDDSLRLGFSPNGTSWDSAMELTALGAGGVLWLGDKTGGGNPAQQRYVRLGYNSASGVSGPATTIELACPNGATMGIDAHIANVAKYGIVTFVTPGTARFGSDIGWGYPNVQYWGSALDIRALSSSISILSSTSVSIEAGGGNSIAFRTAGAFVHPATDGGSALGHPSYRWGQIYSTAGGINTSSAEAKTDIVPLDPADAMGAVRATQPVRFRYKAPPTQPPIAAVRTPYDWREARRRQIARPQVDAALRQYGFVLDDPAFPCDPRFSVGKGQSAATNSIGLLIGAIKNLDARLAALEAA